MTADSAVPARLRTALVRRVHGVHGEVRAEPCGGDATRFRRGMRLRVERDGRELTVRTARDGGDGSVLLAFEEVTDPAAATALRGAYLDVDAADARRLGDDEWFAWQLTGLEVHAQDGRMIGSVLEVEEGVANDVLVVRTPRDVRRYPMVRAFVRSVDLTQRRVVLDPQDEVEA